MTNNINSNQLSKKEIIFKEFAPHAFSVEIKEIEIEPHDYIK